MYDRPAVPPPEPFLHRPVDGEVISSFDTPRGSRRHGGLDIRADAGSPVRAVAAGTVTMAREGYGRYGRLVVVRHDDGVTSWYAHNSENLVTEGDPVEAGQVIALVGHSGNATTAHLHLELRREDGSSFDPAPLLFPAQPR